MKPTICLGGCGRYITEESAMKLNLGKLICLECYVSYSSYKEFRFFREPLRPTRPTFNDKDKGTDLVKRIIKYQLIAHLSITLVVALIWYAIAPESLMWFLIIPSAILVYAMRLSIRDWRADWNERHKRYLERLNDYEKNVEDLLSSYKSEYEKYLKETAAYELVNKNKDEVFKYWLDYPPDWNQRRKQVLHRDDHKCTKCGHPSLRGFPLHVHHKKKLSLGGTNALDNLVTLCELCHMKEPGHEHMEQSWLEREFKRYSDV